MEEQSVETGRQFGAQAAAFDTQYSASSGYGGYCCDTGVDFATLLAQLGGMFSISNSIRTWGVKNPLFKNGFSTSNFDTQYSASKHRG